MDLPFLPDVSPRESEAQPSPPDPTSPVFRNHSSPGGYQTISLAPPQSSPSKIHGRPSAGSSILAGLLLAFLLAKYLSAWREKSRWLLNGPGLLASKYSTGKHFTIQTPERQYTLLSSENHIRELSQAEESHLSLVATAEEVFQPAYTMNGVELNRLGMQHRILRSMTLSLPTLQKPLAALIETAIKQQSKPRTDDQAGWHALSIWGVAQKAISKANTYTFYGAQFASDDTFLDAAIQYPQDVFIAAEALRCTPTFLAPLVSWIVTRGHKSCKTLVSKLLPVFEQRIHGEGCPLTPDYIQHIVEVFPEKSPDMASRMVKQTLALWFASVHQPAIALSNAIVDLCSHDQYQSPLRQEIEDNIRTFGHLDTSKLPLMESFLKESARMNASESISLRRIAKKDFSFGDGLNVPRGTWLCVPQREIMRDSTIYPDAGEFKGFRFVEDHEHNPHSTKNAKFADIHTFYPLWGLGKHACPGRFYASFIIKLTLAELLHNYDLQLSDPSSRRTFRWRSSILPMPTARFEIRRKLRPTSLS